MGSCVEMGLIEAKTVLEEMHRKFFLAVMRKLRALQTEYTYGLH
jgi:hypothetical protein